MPLICLKTYIKAPQQIVFDVSRSVDVHKSSMAHHKEEIIAGTQKGLMNNGDVVTWRANHLLRRRTLKVQITKMQMPYFFCDEMLGGDFKKMKHEHYFEPANEGTLMIDQFYFESTFGILGRLTNKLFLKKYMTRLLTERNIEIKNIAERDYRNNCKPKLIS